MRSVRPPPKVTPPKPPAHLFEPREDVVPIRLEKKLDDAKPYNFEDDVKFQMQQLENEMKLMLMKDNGEAAMSASQLDRRADPRASYGSQQGAPGQHSERINPSDWKVKGFPSEFAYMKATGQLDLPPSTKPNLQSKPQQFNDSFNATRDSRSTYESGYGLQSKQQSAPVFPEPINPKDWKAKGFPSEFAYMKATGQLDIPSNKPIPPMFDSSSASRVPNPSFDPRKDLGSDPGGEPIEQERRYEKEIVSPARRKGGALQNLYVEEDELRRKFASQHSYSDQLQQQATQQRQAREAEQQAHRGVGGGHGGDPRETNMGLRLPSERGPANGRREPPMGFRGGPETERYDPAQLTYGADRNRAPAPDPFHRSAPPGGLRPESLYEAKQISPADRRQGGVPMREEVNTGLLLGLDKNSEKALKRAKQEEYKRQLDQMQQPKQVPAAQASPAESKSYLPTGARQAPERYVPRIPPAAPPALSAYPPASYHDTRLPPEFYGAATEGLRDPYDARNQPDYSNYSKVNYSNGREAPGPPPARYAPTENGYDGPSGYSGPSPGAPGVRGGPSPLRQVPPGRQEDPYRQQAPPQNSSYGYLPERQERGPGLSQAPSSSFGASSGAPAESQEKIKKRLEQEAYRRELEAQMEIKQAKKAQMKKEEEQSDQKFLQQIRAAEASNPQLRAKRGPAADWHAPPAAPPATQQPSYPPNGGRGPSEMMADRAAPRVAPSVRPNASQEADDIAAEVEFMKAQLAQLEQQQRLLGGGRGHARENLFDRDHEKPSSFHQDGPDLRGRDERSDFDQYRQGGPAGPSGPSEIHYGSGDRRGGDAYGRDPAGPSGGYGGRPLDINTDYAEPSSGSATSPFKSPNQARTRMMKDIYGGDLITHTKPDPQQGGNWRPSVGGMNDRKREIIAEQKAALDKQVEDDRARKKKEKDDELEKDRLKDERDRADRERIADVERQEKRKKDQFNEDSARDLAELQQRKEQEALARKGRGAPKNSVQPSSQAPSQAAEDDTRSIHAKPSRSEPQIQSRNQDQNHGRGASTDFTPSAGNKAQRDYDHIQSPVRDLIALQREQQLLMMMASQQSADYGAGGGAGGGRGGGGGISLYESATADEMDRFLRERRANEERGHGGGGGGGGSNYPGGGGGGHPFPQQRGSGYEPSPSSSYSQPYSQFPYPPPQQQREYPPYQQPANHSPYRQQPPQQGFYPARGNFYAPDNDISLVAESRLLPANPFSSSDLLSSLVPIGATAHANAAAQKRNNFNARSEMEKSMASDSSMFYLGQRTPLLEPGVTRPPLQNTEVAVAGVPSRKIHSSGRPSSAAATAKLSNVIEEANRVIEQERLQKSSSGNRQHSDRISPKQDFGSDPTLLGENDGISTTVYRQDVRPRYENNVDNSLDEVPKNRIFLNQKPRYEDKPTAHVMENEVTGYDNNLARSIQLLDSAEKLPRQEAKVAVEMSTQTSELNLLSLAAALGNAEASSAPHSARKSPRKHHTGKEKETSNTESGSTSADGKKRHHHHKHSPRRSPRSPRLEIVEGALTTEVDAEPVPIDGTFYNYGITPRADGSDTPDTYMSSMKYDPPFSPALAPQIAPSVMEGKPEEEADKQGVSQRRNVINANANLVKPGDHRSPRQRALDNKQAREAALASGAELPARKHKPIEEEFAELTSPEVPRLPRKNIFDANEALLQVPTDNRYRSPRQRALDRENSKKSNFSPRPMDQTLDPVESTIVATESVNPVPIQESSPRESEGDEESKYLPYVTNGSVDDTRFNEWPAELGGAEVNNENTDGDEYVNDDFPPEDLVRDPKQVEVEKTDEETPIEQQEYEAEFESEYPVDAHNGGEIQTPAPYDGAAWDDDFQGEQVPTEVANLDLTGSAQSLEGEELEYDHEYEQSYEQENDPVYEQEANVSYEAPTQEDETSPEAALEFPEYTNNEDEYSFVVESNMPYEYYEDDDEEEAVPAPLRADETDMVSISTMVAATDAVAETAEAADEVNLAESDEPQAVLGARHLVGEELPVDLLPEVTARNSKSRPTSSRPRTGLGRVDLVESDHTHTESRPTTGRPKSSSVRESQPEETGFPAQVLTSRPSTGRPRTGASPSAFLHAQDSITTETATLAEIKGASRPNTSDRPRTSTLELSQKTNSVTVPGFSSRPSTSGRPRTGVIEVPADSTNPSVSSRPPTSSRPRSDAPVLSSRAPGDSESVLRDSVADDPILSRPSTTGRPRTGASIDAHDPTENEPNWNEAPVASSRPVTSSRPRSSTSLSSRVPDALEQAINETVVESLAQPPNSSRPGTSGRPRTGVPPLASRAPDTLEQAINESTDRPLLSRPVTSTRPRSSVPLSSREPDILDQAINAPVSSRPGTSGRLRVDAAPLSGRVPDALEQVLTDTVTQSPVASRPPTSSRSRPRTGAHSSEIDALDQALAWSAPVTH